MQRPQEIGLFWDYENVSLRKQDRVRAQALSNKLEQIILQRVPNGCVVQKNLFFDNAKNCMFQKEKEALLIGGWDLKDCPTRNKKEFIDKKIIVDVMAFALCGNTRQKTVVLMSGDGDYAYMLSKLNGLGVQTIVVFPGKIAAPVLREAASMELCWESDIICGGADSLCLFGTKFPNEVIGTPLQMETQHVFSRLAEDFVQPFSLTETKSNAAVSDLHGNYNTFLSAVAKTNTDGWAAVSKVFNTFYARKGLKGSQKKVVINSTMKYVSTKSLVEFADQKKYTWTQAIGLHQMKGATKGSPIIAYVRLTDEGLAYLHRSDTTV